ncbi:MAG: DUF4931 domain-containing protein [Quinella sp. 2Q5]|nr:DUF4931 domain-containing protein [Quinella sp. 2Q5]
MEINLVEFNTDIGKTKPENFVHAETACPFCDVKHLTGIIETEGDIIFLRNKYNVIGGADQFVLIEGRECSTDMPDYPREKMRRVIRMGVRQWKNLLASGKYEEVLFFKNYGLMSGGTLRHPHMQLVGFPRLKSELLFDEAELSGIVIDERDGVQFNISNCPRVGFGELNVVCQSGGSLDRLADYLQVGVHWAMNHFSRKCTSYNIFFYRRGEKIFAKVMPRYATSPYFVGYNIHFLPNNVARIADEIRQLYSDALSAT